MTSALFDIAAEKLGECSGMDRLAARGTLRLALKQAGLEANNLMIRQLRAVFEKLMPKELEARGVTDAVARCKTAIDAIDCVAKETDLSTSSSTDEIFERLGGN